MREDSKDENSLIHHRNSILIGTVLPWDGTAPTLRLKTKQLYCLLMFSCVAGPRDVGHSPGLDLHTAGDQPHSPGAIAAGTGLGVGGARPGACGRRKIAVRAKRKHMLSFGECIHRSLISPGWLSKLWYTLGRPEYAFWPFQAVPGLWLRAYHSEEAPKPPGYALLLLPNSLSFPFVAQVLGSSHLGNPPSDASGIPRGALQLPGRYPGALDPAQGHHGPPEPIPDAQGPSVLAQVRHRSTLGPWTLPQGYHCPPEPIPDALRSALVAQVHHRYIPGTPVVKPAVEGLQWLLGSTATVTAGAPLWYGILWVCGGLPTELPEHTGGMLRVGTVTPGFGFPLGADMKPRYGTA